MDPKPELKGPRGNGPRLSSFIDMIGGAASRGAALAPRISIAAEAGAESSCVLLRGCGT